MNLADLAKRQIEKNAGTREQNRRNCPQAAATMDALAMFQPRMVWWRENGHTLGKAPE